MPSKPLVFLSYSHKDEASAEELLKFLRPLEQTANFQVWSDKELKLGDDWERKIAEALDRTDVAILLVSADYLASRWVQDRELPQLFKKRENKELRILPIIIRPAPWVHTPLAYYQVWPRDGRAISELPINERDRLWTEFAETLSAIIHRLGEGDSPAAAAVAEKTDTRRDGRIHENPSSTRTVRGPKVVPPSFFISHATEDGDFAENLKSRMTGAGFAGWMDIDVLEAGVDWRKEIDEALHAACGVILVLSPDSKTSEYVTYEWAYGLGLGLRIVPLLLRETPIHPRLEAFQYLDFTNRRARPWDRLFALLKELSDSKDKADNES
jgi:TIR domain